MHVCVTKHRWLLALRFWGADLGAIPEQGLSGTTWRRKKDGPGTFRMGISLGKRGLWIQNRGEQEQPAQQTGGKGS